MSDWHDKAIQAAEQGRWEEAISHALRSSPSHGVWGAFPGMGMPAHAVEQAVRHLSSPFSPHKGSLAPFLDRLTQNLPKNLSAATINRLVALDHDNPDFREALSGHSQYRDDGAKQLQAAKFWEDYEQDPQPHHFATVKSLFTNIPEITTDHRGEHGSSRDHMALLPYLQEHAAEVQKKLLHDVHGGDEQDIKIRHVKGEPHVRAYRGVSGFYAEALREAANLNPETGEVDRKLLKVPATHLSSWSIDPQSAREFAFTDHPGHPAGQGLVLENWIPLKQLLHKGKDALVFGFDKGRFKIPTSGLHLPAESGGLKPVAVRAHGEVAVAKSEPLTKMAIKDIPVGQPIQTPRPGWDTFDYSHVLPEHHRKAGYRVLVSHKTSPDNPRVAEVRSTLIHPSGPKGDNLVWPKEVGAVVGEIAPEPAVAGAKALNPDASHIHSAHRGKGLGVAAYEALFAHAKNHHNAHFITSRGAPHSTMAGRVHESLARKHGLKYHAEHLDNDYEPGEFDFKRGPYLYQSKADADWHKSENWDSLEKMAVADLPRGKEIPEHPSLTTKPDTRTFDYSHLLTPEQRKQGYELILQDRKNGSSVRSWVNHAKDAVVGVVEGEVHHGPKPKLAVEYAKLQDDHRGKGVGVAAYEAMFAHAKHHHNVETVSSMGQRHSSMAHAAHRKLSQKHGMDYQAHQVHQIRPGPFDEKYSSYEYGLKNEAQWAKSESNLLDGANNAHTIQAMLGFSPARQSAFAAARFLAAGNVASLEQIRRALWEQDGDVEKAALQAYGLPVDEKTLASLRAVMSVEQMRKGESEDETPRAHTILPGVPTATETAVKVKRAFDTLNVEYVKLAGKHSAGSMIARDPDTREILILKPGSGGQSPAAGASEDPSSQSRREAAYSAVAQQWGISEIPQADLLLIDGKEYAALHTLGYAYKSMEKARAENANVVRDALEKAAALPTVFKWATLDYVLGNPDRHANNIMIDKEGHIRLIDHGSAFAGASFSPAHDRNSFVPYYLRFRFGGNFNALPMERKMEIMPRLHPDQERVFKLWLTQIDKYRLTHILQSYGIDPKPALARLAQLQLNEGEPADVTVNRAWAGA